MLKAACSGSRLTFLCVLAGAGIATTALGQSEFTPGRVFISAYDSDRVAEYKLDGTFVRLIGSGTVLDGPHGLTFGPDGKLYVVSQGTDKVMVFEPNGSSSLTFGTGALDGARGIAVAPNGNLMVTAINTGLIHEYELDGGFVRNVTQGIAQTSFTDLSFGVDSKLYSNVFNLDRISVVDVEGVLIRNFNAEGSPIDSPESIAFTPAGRLMVSAGNQDSIFELELDGTVAGTINTASYAASPRGIAFGPDGKLWVSDYMDDQVFRIDGGGVLFASGTNVDGATAIAFSPYRLKVKITGSLLVEGGAATPVSVDAIASYSPFSRRVLLAPVNADVNEFQNLFGTTARAFFGIEVKRSGTLQELTLVSAAGKDVGVAQSGLHLKVTGKTKQGAFVPEEAKGELQISAVGRSFAGKVKPRN